MSTPCPLPPISVTLSSYQQFSNPSYGPVTNYNFYGQSLRHSASSPALMQSARLCPQTSQRIVCFHLPDILEDTPDLIHEKDILEVADQYSFRLEGKIADNSKGFFKRVASIFKFKKHPLTSKEQAVGAGNVEAHIKKVLCI